MVRVTPIKLQAGTKVLWFDPAEHNVQAGDQVIVSTERGQEFGTATADIMEVTDEMISQLKSPLKPVVRIADEADKQRAEELRQKGEEALSTFKELAAQTSDQMRPVMVEFLFDGDKAVFYFESEERIDFRELVRKLASVFHVRVDMRQIGVRDGARMIGGLGHCGQELCCARLGGEFSPVSIRMAKEQNLSLNPQKISGCCGRLMCCLRYEYEAYKEVNSRAPKNGAKIEVPGGMAKVTEVNVPLERVTLELEDGKQIKIPLSEMEVAGEGKRPNRVSQEVFDKYANPDPFKLFEGASANLEVASFTTVDKLAKPGAHSHRMNQGGKRDRRDTRPSREDSSSKHASSKENSHRRPRRRHHKVSADGQTSQTTTGQNAKKQEPKKQESKALRKTGPKAIQKTEGSQRKGEGKSSHSQRHGKGGQRGSKQSNKQAQQRQGQQRQGQKASRQDQQSKSHKRPGQKSSGIRNAPDNQGQHNQTKHVAEGDQPKRDMTHRRPRRRHRKSGGEHTNAE